MKRWQQIKTAPKDGTVVRVKNDEWEGCGLQSVMNGRFFRGEWERVPKYMTLGPGRVVPDPTHWMPLHDAQERDRR